MSAPDRIWAEPPEVFDYMGFWQEKPMAGFTEYIRLDPNTRVVTVDQLNRWARVWHGKPADQWSAYQEIRAIIGEVK